jgi:hypothetical protein
VPWRRGNAPGAGAEERPSHACGTYRRRRDPVGSPLGAQLRQLRGLRDQLPPAGHNNPVSFLCPGAQARDLIRTTARNAIAALAELVDGPTTNDEKGRARLRATAEATTAWIQTLLDYQAVEGFSFDPSTNPLAEW